MYFEIRCPNFIPHNEENRKSEVDNNEPEYTRRDYCGSILKLFSNPKAIFNEIFICGRCGAHWQIIRNAKGATSCTLISSKIKVPSKWEPMQVLGIKKQRGKSGRRYSK